MTKATHIQVSPELQIPFVVTVQGTAGLTSQFIDGMLEQARDPEHPGHTAFLAGLLAASDTAAGVNRRAFAEGLVRQVVRSATRGTVGACFAEAGQALTLAPVKLDVQQGRIKHDGMGAPALHPRTVICAWDADGEEYFARVSDYDTAWKWPIRGDERKPCSWNFVEYEILREGND